MYRREKSNINEAQYKTGTISYKKRRQTAIPTKDPRPTYSVKEDKSLADFVEIMT